MIAPVLIILLMFMSLPGLTANGYQFLDGTSRTAIKFELYRNLIVIPAQINDTVRVKLILDTGTRSLLLYGKRFASLPNLSSSRRLKVVGWGSPEGVDAAVSFPNEIRIGDILGEGVAVATITNRNLFEDKTSIDGIIGYELFVKFVVEIDYRARMIYLFERMPRGRTKQFTSVPLEINRAMPQVLSSVVLKDHSKVDLRLLIDTGSSLGLTLFSKDKFSNHSGEVLHPIGRGLNGIVKGFDLYLKHFFLGDMKVRTRESYVVNVEEHPDDKFTYCGSVGAAFLKKHVVIFDYSSSRMFLLSYKTAKAVARATNKRFPRPSLTAHAPDRGWGHNQ